MSGRPPLSPTLLLVLALTPWARVTPLGATVGLPPLPPWLRLIAAWARLADVEASFFLSLLPLLPS